MAKKIIIVLLFLLTLTGCSVEYNLTIDAENFAEKTDIMTDTSLDTPEVYQNNNLTDYFDLSQNEYYEPIYFNPANYDFYEGGYQKGTLYYELKNYQNGNFKGLTLSHTFDNTDFYRSSIIKSCYEELSIQRSNNFVIMKTNNKCRAFDRFPLLDKIDINIKTDLKVIYSNADSINGNVYTWYLDRTNYNNKIISLTYKKGDESAEESPIPGNSNPNIIEDKPEESTSEKDNNNNILFIIAGFLVLVVVITAMINLKNKKYE